MDFVSDSLASGRRLKCLTVADDVSHEAVEIAVDYGISGVYVRRLLDQAARFRGYRAAVRTDNGPEFVAIELTAWLAEVGAATFHIEPGKPWQNGYGESFNARLRDECLNMEEFWSPPHARALIEAWRIEYNSEHLHSSLGYMTPDEFAARFSAALEQDAA